MLATISSHANYSTKLGPAALNLGGSNSQHPGRKEVDRTFPVFSLSAPPIALAQWMDWTPVFSFQTNQQLNLDQTGEFTYRYFTNPQGVRDSVSLKRNARQTSSTFSTRPRKTASALFAASMGASLIAAFRVAATSSIDSIQWLLGESLTTRSLSWTWHG